ncbi:nuclease-related domain-containing protein [Actinopolymorpha pittospori]|uniref:NERD domain-containing protein n=1 Tax=Actinopolymorpha pittospori TaxID=648752 RepID=A0A927MQP0_9ACTN|nr:nuclease-related domain-containing protein [Actinopolymorpha pittospori]MBE1605120.1 hypothetical protein [Actinopolymorpha pittospori]
MRTPRSDQTARARTRQLRLAGAAAALLVVFVFALQDGLTVVLAATGLVVAGFVWWVRRSRTGALAVLSLCVACVVTSEVARAAAESSRGASPLGLGVVFWLFLAVVTVTAWAATRERPRRRLLTVVAGQVTLVLASLLSYLSVTVMPVAGLVVAMAIVVVASRLRYAPHLVTPEDAATSQGPAILARGTERTRAALTTALDEEWLVRSGVDLPGGATVEHLVVGPAGVFVVESRTWPGRVGLVSVERDGETVEAYGLDGDVRELAARLEPVLRTVTAAADLPWLAEVDVYAVVALWGTAVPEQPVDLELRDPRRPGRGVAVRLVSGEQVGESMRARPRTLNDRELSRVRGRVETQAPVGRSGS